MIWLFIVFIILALLHFVYDGILAPSFRFENRLELFKLRDDIRSLKIKNGQKFNDELFTHFESHINRQIHLLHNFTIFGLWQFYKASKGDVEITERVERYKTLLNESKVEEVKEIDGKTSEALLKAVAANAGGWAFYIIPLFFIGVLVFSGANKFLSLATILYEMPENTFLRFFPPSKTI
jgi:hypothetical protein